MKLFLNKISIPAIVCDKDGRFVRGNRTLDTLPCLGRGGNALNMLSPELRETYLTLLRDTDGRTESSRPFVTCKGDFCTAYILFLGDKVFSDVNPGETVWLFLNHEIPQYTLSDFYAVLLNLCRGAKAVTPESLTASAIELAKRVMVKTAESRLTEDLPFSYDAEEAISSLKKCAELYVKARGAYLRCSVQSMAASDTSSVISRAQDFHLTAPFFMTMLSAFCDISEKNIVNVGFRIADENLMVNMTTECKRLSSRTENAPARLVEKSLTDVEETAKKLLSDGYRYGWLVQRQKRLERERFCATAELSMPLSSCVETGIRHKSKIESLLCDFDLVKTLVGLYKTVKCKETDSFSGFCLGCKGKSTTFTPLSHGNHTICVK